MVFCNCVVPQIFCSRGAHARRYHLVRVDPHQRRHVVRAFQHRRHLAPPRLPALELAQLRADRVDISLFIGTIGLFSTLSCCSSSSWPAVAITEVKELRHEMEHEAHHAAGAHG